MKKYFLFILFVICTVYISSAQKDTTRYVINKKDRIIQVYQGDSMFTVTFDDMVVYLLNEAIQKAEKGQYKQALKDLENSFMYSTENADVYYNMGLIYYNLQNYEKSSESLNKALEIKPNFYDALNQRGIVFTMQKQYSRAMEDFDKAISLQPQNSQAYFNKAIALLYMSEKEKSCILLEKAYNLGEERAKELIIKYCK